MNCHDAKGLMHAYLDGELDVVRTLEMEEHLRGCPACGVLAKNGQTVKSAVRNGALYQPAPARLQRKVHAALLAIEQPSVGSFSWWRSWKTLTGALAVLALIGSAAGMVLKKHRPTYQEIMLSIMANTHTEGLQPSRLTEVASADSQEVREWFAGNLDFKPQVADLSGSGFPLVGGRKDQVNDHPVAAVVYKRREHLITLFIWPPNCSEEGADRMEPRGALNVHQWQQGDMTFGVVSDLNEPELRAFVDSAKKVMMPAGAEPAH